MAYTPIAEQSLHYYGELPEKSGDANLYQLSESNIPAAAKEVLVYLWATTKGDESFHRYYYRIQTTDGQAWYSQYMNVAASKDVSLNSTNVWLPVFKDHGEVRVELVDAEDSSKKGGKSIAHRSKSSNQDVTFSGLFLVGYRT